MNADDESPRTVTVPRSALWRAWRTVVRQFGDRGAITEAGTGAQCTFRELDRRAEAWARQHLGADDRWQGGAILFAVPNGIGWFEIFLALLRGGAVAVPLDASEPTAGIRAHATALRAAGWWDGERLHRGDAPRRFRDPEIALIKLTSGSTGQPRPLVFSAAEMLADGRQVATTMGIRRTDLNYAIIPLGHSYGLGNLTIPLIAQGVPLVCGAAPLPHAVAADFTRWQPTVFPGVPAFWRALAAADVPAPALASLRLAISAGAPLAPDAARDFEVRFGRRLHNFYGSSETGGIAFDLTGRATLAGSVGRALRGVRLRLVGSRLHVSSPAVFTQGNRRREEGRGGWIPPDRVAVDARGFLTLLGRRGRTVKIGGRRLNLAEVTARIRRLPGVEDVWLGVSDDAEPMLGVAVVSGRPVVELRTQLHAELPSWKLPKKWLGLARWPLTARGKVDTRAVRAAVFARR